MLEINYSEFINEEMAAISANKLRDAIHDIVVELSPKQVLEIEELSNILISEYKITISPQFIDKFLDEYLKARRGDTKAKTFFTRDDTRWLGVRDVDGTKQIRNNLHFLAPSLAKHKQRLWKDDEKRTIEDAYKAGMKDLNFSEDLIKQSLVLQYPTDSEEMIKQIYKDVIITKRFENTPENCWKMMMVLAKNQKLDRKRNWFNIAPKGIKNSFNKDGKIDYTLVRTKKDKDDKNTPTKKKPIDKTPIDVSVKEKDNLKKIDNRLANYEHWEAIQNNFSKRNLIELIDSLVPEKTENIKPFDEFLIKTEILTALLVRYYLVNKKDVYDFYFKTGFADYVSQWDDSGVRPKITDF